jgi:hypothetical protein
MGGFTPSILAQVVLKEIPQHDHQPYELDPHQWTPEYMDEQHWIGVCAVMPYAEQLIQMAGAIHALAQPR